MVALVRPDVYIRESLTSTNQSYFPALSPGVFVGYSRRGPVVATQVDSWTTYQRLYGGFVGGSDDDLAVAVYNYFLNGGGGCWVLRVVGSGGVLATRAYVERRVSAPGTAFTVNAKNVGTWGNTVYVEILDTGVVGRFNLNVRIGGSGDQFVVERWTDLTMDPAGPRNVFTVLNDPLAGSTVITLVAGAAFTDVANSTPAVSSSSGGDVLTGGADNTTPPTTGSTGDYINALPKLDVITSQMLLNLVSITDGPTINALIAYAAARTDTMVIIDSQKNRTATQAASDAAALTASSFAATYWPPVYVNDPSTLGTVSRLVSPAALVMGLISTLDRSRGSYKAPAGMSARLIGVLGLESRPTLSDYTTLAAGFVNAIRYWPQIASGYVVFGSHTLKATQADSQISVRRTLISLEQALTNATRMAQFENNDALLWGELYSSADAILRELWQDGGLAGANASDAYYVICDETNNTATTVAAGEVHLEVGVALQIPAQFIVINVGQYDGNVTVTNNLAA